MGKRTPEVTAEMKAESLARVDALRAEGMTADEACWEVGIAIKTYYRRRKVAGLVEPRAPRQVAPGPKVCERPGKLNKVLHDDYSELLLCSAYRWAARSGFPLSQLQCPAGDSYGSQAHQMDRSRRSRSRG